MTVKVKKLKPRTFSRDVVIVVLSFSMVVLIGVGYLAARTKRHVARQYIEGTAKSASDDFVAMNQSMEASLTMVQGWGTSGLISLSDEQKLARLLLPVFGREAMLNGISVADVDGDSFHLQLEGERLRTRLIRSETRPRNETRTVWSREFEPQESSSTNTTYDPRKRPWFSPAFQTEWVHWTDPYTFYSSGQVGITASASFSNRSADRKMVVAFDIELEELFNAMYALAPSTGSRVFLFRNDASLYLPDPDGVGSSFLAMDRVQDDLVRKAHSRWANARRLDDRILRVTHDGSGWWCGFHPLDESRRVSWLCVMIPENDIRNEAGLLTLQLWLIGFGVLVVAAGLACWIIQHYGRLSDAGESFDSAHPVASIRELIAGGENRYVEFKSTMRMNLHSQKPGKEIELAWLKGVCTLLNTDGGILLLGVTDAGEITGLEQDVFENDDKCALHFKNLIARHIGAEMSKYIRFKRIPVDGKTVGVVQCSRSSRPAFLKDRDKEAFYIRNGPASDELPVSKVLSYIKHRK